MTTALDILCAVLAVSFHGLGLTKAGPTRVILSVECSVGMWAYAS